ncbi:MAG: endonuclease/exonuclease/phosphatase family protein [Solirubrobacterales bacterium]
MTRRRAALWALRAAVAVLGLWAIVRLLGLERGFPLVALIAFTPYVALIAVAVLALSAIARAWREAVVLSMIVAVFAAVVLPRAFPSQPAVSGTERVSLDLLTSNLHLGEADAEELVALIRESGSDLVSLQELTETEVDRLRTAGIDELLPEQHLRPTPAGSSGAGIYSRYPLRTLGEVPGGISRMVRALVEVPGAQPVDIVAVHAYPPNWLTTTEWREGLEALPVADAEGPVRILAGDFNSSFDHEEFRRVVDGGYVDAAAALGLGLGPTWPTRFVTAPPVTIDHVLADERARVERYAAVDLPGTDHRALAVSLGLPKPDPAAG